VKYYRTVTRTRVFIATAASVLRIVFILRDDTAVGKALIGCAVDPDKVKEYTEGAGGGGDGQVVSDVLGK